MVILHNVLTAVASQLKRIREGQMWSFPLVTSYQDSKSIGKILKHVVFSDFAIKDVQPAIWRLILHESLARHVWFRYNGSDFHQITE